MRGRHGYLTEVGMAAIMFLFVFVVIVVGVLCADVFGF